MKISMREWARGAVQSTDVSSSANDSFSAFGPDPSKWPADAKRSLAVTSDAFLASALKIAAALARQICQAEEAEEAASSTQSTHVNQRDRPRNSNILPVPSTDWAAHVVIHLTSKSRSSNPEQEDFSIAEDYDLQPLPFSAAGNPGQNRAEDFEAVLNSFVNKEEKKEQPNESTYLDVNDAEIIAPTDQTKRGSLREENEQIFSLGLVFYELFSGGNIPPELESMKPSSTDADSEDEFGSDPLPPDELLQHFVSENKIDQIHMEDAAQILGVLGSDDELFGDGNTQSDPLPPDELSQHIVSETQMDQINIGDAAEILEDLGSDDELFGDSNAQSNGRDGRQSKKSRESQPNATPIGKRMTSVSMEPLKMLRLPAALCDLIQNMLDCASGDFKGDETYCHMADILGDLQLMIDRPDLFLRDLDLDQLTTAGLKIDDFTFERDSELSNLWTAYQRSISGKSELGIISGPSGVGKSVLANQFAQRVTSNGGIFLNGKFDQLHRARPFSAIADAFNGYCDILLRDFGSSRSTSVASKLRVVLGREVCYLVTVIPKLRHILGEDSLVDTFPDSDCRDGQKRIQYLLCQFVKVISSSSVAPITLFLDDLQWADPSSIDVIKQLLLMYGSPGENRQFFFLCCCRENEVDESHPVGEMFTSVRDFGVKGTVVSLCCMDKDLLNTNISKLLCLSPRLTRTLSEIVYHKTKGSPLFFSRLMLSLNKEGLLRISLSRRRWVWNQDLIQQREIPDDVAEFLITTIRQLPKEVQSALCVLSCFGSSTDCLVLKIIEEKFQIPLICSLEEAAAGGLLDKNDDAFKFSHDRVLEAAYHLTKSEERCLNHSKYGIALCTEALKCHNSNILFTAVDQLNRGGPAAVSEKSQFLTIARMNLMAGKRALQMSDYGTAFSFFDHGITFLRKNHWKEHYELSLDIFECASKAAFVIGDMTSLNILCDQIMKNTRSFEDRLNTLYIATNALAYSSKLQESINKGFSVLSQLGEEIPSECSRSDVLLDATKMREIFVGVSDDDLLNYKRMEDNSKVMAMKFLAKLNASLYMMRPNLQPLVTFRMIELSLVHGMSPISPQAFAFFGSVLASLGNVREGYRFVKIASDLNERYGSKEVAGEVVCVSTQLKCFVEPVQATNETHIEGHSISLAAGDMYNAILNSLFHCGGAFWSGANLTTITQHFSTARHLMQQQNHISWLMQLAPIERTVLTLIGPSEPGRRACKETPMEFDLLQKNPHQSMVYHFHKMLISLYFREFDKTKYFAEKYVDLISPSWIMMYGFAMRKFITGLVSFWILRKSNNNRTWMERGKSAIRSFELWANSSKYFENKLFLLEAESQYCRGELDAAKFSYEKAITSAKEHQFIHEEALSWELAGYFHLDLGSKGKSFNYFTKAQDRYRDWGAYAKASQLRRFVTECIDMTSREASGSTEYEGFRNALNEKQSNIRKRAPENPSS